MNDQLYSFTHQVKSESLGRLSLRLSQTSQASAILADCHLIRFNMKFDLKLNRFEISILFVALEEYINKTKPHKNSHTWDILEYLGKCIEQEQYKCPETN